MFGFLVVDCFILLVVVKLCCRNFAFFKKNPKNFWEFSQYCNLGANLSRDVLSLLVLEDKMQITELLMFGISLSLELLNFSKH